MGAKIQADRKDVLSVTIYSG